MTEETPERLDAAKLAAVFAASPFMSTLKLEVLGMDYDKSELSVRMPLHPVAIELLREVGPMAVSSANISGRPAAVTVDDARHQLGDLVEVYLDGGPSEQQAASTIVDLTGAHPRVLRQGPVTVQAIAEVLGVEPETLTA